MIFEIVPGNKIDTNDWTLEEYQKYLHFLSLEMYTKAFTMPKKEYLQKVGIIRSLEKIIKSAQENN